MKMAVNGVVGLAPSAAMMELPAGPGVFETLLIQAGMPVFFDDHWARFTAGCQWHGLDRPMTPEGMSRLAAMLARENAVSTGVLRFAAWRGDKGVEWRVDAGPPRTHMARPDFRVGWGAALPPATADRPFKHLNRGRWLQALRTARAAGWDEVILPDQAGRIVEGAVSNVFFVRDGGLHTPALDVGPLPGIMRGRVLALARTMGWTVREDIYTAADLQQASEIWLSNSLIGLRAATSLDERGLGDAPPMLQRFRAGWRSEYGWDPVVVATRE